MNNIKSSLFIIYVTSKIRDHSQRTTTQFHPFSPPIHLPTHPLSIFLSRMIQVSPTTFLHQFAVLHFLSPHQRITTPLPKGRLCNVEEMIVKSCTSARQRRVVLSFEYLDWKGRRGGWRPNKGWHRRGGSLSEAGRNLGPLNRVFREIYEIWTDKVGNKNGAPEKEGKRLVDGVGG